MNTVHNTYGDIHKINLTISSNATIRIRQARDKRFHQYGQSGVKFPGIVKVVTFSQLWTLNFYGNLNANSQKKPYKKTELNVLNSEKVSSQLSSFIEWVASSSTYWAKNLCFLVPEATGRKRALSRIFLPSLQTSQHLTAVQLGRFCLKSRFWHEKRSLNLR